MTASVYAPRPTETAMAEMNVTPLVDVMLVLLVIFMITAPALTRTLPMNLPIPDARKSIPPAYVDLHVGAHGDYMLEGRVVSAHALPAALANVATTAPEAVLRLSAADESEYQGFATALSVAQASGIVNISLDN